MWKYMQLNESNTLETHSVFHNLIKESSIGHFLNSLMCVCLPLLIVARLLPAAVQSHNSMAFTPHILANHPLSRVAGSSAEKRHPFFQLHSAETEQMSLWTYETDSPLSPQIYFFQWIIGYIQLIRAQQLNPKRQWFLFPSLCLELHYPDGSLHCVVFKRCHSCYLGLITLFLFHRRNNWLFQTCVLSVSCSSSSSNHNTYSTCHLCVS